MERNQRSAPRKCLSPLRRTATTPLHCPVPAVEPEVILFDEPCASLDPISTRSIEELILQLKNYYTIVIVTHNMQQAARISDYTAFLYMGELIEFGETQKLFTVPKEKMTEEYLTGKFG